MARLYPSRFTSPTLRYVAGGGCPSGGTHHARDENAGKNILAVGLTVIACGATVRPKSVKGGGRCHEAGSNSSDAVKTQKRRKSSEESPTSKTVARGASA